MPIYEYRCLICGRRTEVLLLSGRAEAPACQSCGSGELQRVMSRFAHHKSEADRLAAVDLSREPGADFCSDDRNIGLRAKKRLQELNVDVGEHFDAMVEKAKADTKEALGS